MKKAVDQAMTEAMNDIAIDIKWKYLTKEEFFAITKLAGDDYDVSVYDIG